MALQIGGCRLQEETHGVAGAEQAELLALEGQILLKSSASFAPSPPRGCIWQVSSRSVESCILGSGGKLPCKQESLYYGSTLTLT